MEYISASRIKLLLECKKKFYHRYVTGKLEDESGPHAQLGTAIHKVLEIYRENPSLTKQQLIGILNKNFDAKAEQFLFKEGCRMIWKLDPRQIFLGELVGVEKEFEEVIEGIPVRGIIDKIEKVGDEFVVTDYKTNKKVEPTDYHHQLALYDVVMEKLYPGTQRRYELFYVRHGQSVEMKFSPEQAEQMIGSVTRIMHYVKENAENPAEFPKLPNRAPMCRYCPLQNSCW